MPPTSDTQPPSDSASSTTAFVESDDWEYEYSSTETTTHYVSIDLTTHVPNAERRHPAPKPVVGRRIRHARADTRRLASPDIHDLDDPLDDAARDGLTAADDDDDDDDEPDAYDDDDPFESAPRPSRPRKRARRKHVKTYMRPMSRGSSSARSSDAAEDASSSADDTAARNLPDSLQLLDLHTRRPLLAVGGTVYALEYASPIGTDLHFSIPSRRAPAGASARLLASSTTRLVARPLKLEPRAPNPTDELPEIDRLLLLLDRSAQKTPAVGARYSLVADGASHAGPVQPAPAPAPAPAPLDDATPVLQQDRGPSAFMTRLLSTKRARGERSSPPPRTAPATLNPSATATEKKQTEYRMAHTTAPTSSSRGSRVAKLPRRRDMRRVNALFGEYPASARGRGAGGDATSRVLEAGPLPGFSAGRGGACWAFEGVPPRRGSRDGPRDGLQDGSRDKDGGGDGDGNSPRDEEEGVGEGEGEGGQT